MRFLAIITDLSEAEFEFTHQLTLIDDFDMKGVQSKSDFYYAQTGKCRNASATVKLVGSEEVNEARGELVDKHNDIQNLIQPLALAIARAGNPQSYAGSSAKSRESWRRSSVMTAACARTLSMQRRET